MRTWLPLVVLFAAVSTAHAQSQDPAAGLETAAEPGWGPIQQQSAMEYAPAPQGAPGLPPGPAPAGATPAPALPPQASPAAKDEYYTLDELKGEMRKLVWTKGDVKIVPYGILWGNMVYETQRTNPGSYTLYVFPERPDLNQAFQADGRSTRFGVDVQGPVVPLLQCAPVGGKIEFDFQRVIDTENRGSVLLRHAYVDVKNDEFRLLAGQTWDVISPLYPGMLMYSVGWGGGNIGYRRAQVRGERYLDVSDTLLLTLQGSLNTDIISDTGAAFTSQKAGWPVLEGRIGTTLGPRGPGSRPIEIGVSSHLGETIYDIGPPFPNPVIGLVRPTWSLNGDLRVPLTERFGVQGEFFTGENLGAYFGGIVQGVDIGSPATPGSRDAIRSTGGWFDVWYDWTAKLHSHVGYGIDDPLDRDITVGRTYNTFFFGNVSYDLTQKFLVGVEVSYWKTLWVGQPDGNSAHFDFVAKYFF